MGGVAARPSKTSKPHLDDWCPATGSTETTPRAYYTKTSPGASPSAVASNARATTRVRTTCSVIVDTDTELEKLLAQAEAALEVLSGPFICCRPFKRRKAHMQLKEVMWRMRRIPASRLMKSDIGRTMEQNGMDKDTSTFLSNLLGIEHVKSSKSMDFTLAPPASHVSLPNTPATPSQSCPLLSYVSETPRYSFTEVTDWANFDIFEAACTIPRGRLFLELFLIADSGFDLVGGVKFSMGCLAPCLEMAQSMYEEPFQTTRQNTYHTALHGADVLCGAVSIMMEVQRNCIGLRLPALSKFAVVIASLLHDLRHPGLQARFLEAVQHEVAMTYLDDSPLERYHLAEIFRLLHRYGVLKSFSDVENKKFRRLVCGMVLATDFTQGYRNTAAVKAAFPTMFSETPKHCPREGIPPSPLRRTVTVTRSNSCTSLDTMAPYSDVCAELLNLVVECADVSHAAKPLELHQRWSVLITHEFTFQGELEAERGLPVSPLCSPSATTDATAFAGFQQGFIDFVVRPKYSVLARLCGQEVWLKHVEENHTFWGSETYHGFAEVCELVGLSNAFKQGPAIARGAELAGSRARER